MTDRSANPVPVLHRVVSYTLWITLAVLVVVTTMVVLQNLDDADTGTLSLTQAQRQWLADHPDIRLGPYANYAPAQFIDEDGNHAGIAADYCTLIEQKLGIRFAEVRTDTWQHILDKAKARELDFIALIAENEERKEYLTFTKPFLNLPAVIITREGVDKHGTTPWCRTWWSRERYRRRQLPITRSAISSIERWVRREQSRWTSSKESLCPATFSCSAAMAWPGC